MSLLDLANQRIKLDGRDDKGFRKYLAPAVLTEKTVHPVPHKPTSLAVEPQLLFSSSQGQLVRLAASTPALITLGLPSPHPAHLSSLSNLSSP